MTTTSAPREDGAQTILVARQPIFNRDREIWGYELLFCLPETEEGDSVCLDDENMASRIIADGLPTALIDLPPESQILLKCPPRFILDQSYLMFPENRCVIALDCSELMDEHLFEACARLKDQGYSLAVNDYRGEEAISAFAGIADYARIDVGDIPAREVIRLRKSLRPFECRSIAAGVTSWEVFEGVRSIGFTDFQGPFFSKPEIVPGRKIPAGMTARLELMQEISRRECHIEELPRIIGHDPSLSYRLLKFINSAAFSLRSTVASIQQAVSLLGCSPLRRWAQVVLMADMDESYKGAELTFNALKRAKFIESLAAISPKFADRQESMFLLGMLSLMDAMLGIPMEQVLDGMPLDEEFRAALCGDLHELRAWIDLVECVEVADWETARKYMKALGISPSQAASKYMQANTWAREHCEGFQRRGAAAAHG